MIGLVEFMPQHQTHSSAIGDIEPLSPLVDLRRPGVADLLARQQEEYDEHLVGMNANETPNYLVKLRAAQQAAQNATKNDLGPQYSYWSRIGLAVAIAFLILQILKFRYS